ncbi:MAG: hypothetical protein LBB61_04045 [Treponema sp.]|nr:hypothetical protein [Treponema sp.]
MGNYDGTIPAGQDTTGVFLRYYVVTIPMESAQNKIALETERCTSTPDGERVRIILPRICEYS